MQQATPPVPAQPVSRADALLTGVGRADPRAFAAFYDLYLPRVYGWCLARTADHAKAQALTETILVDALDRLETREGAAPLAVQILRAARRACGP